MIKIQAHTKGAGFRPFWFAPLGSLPHWETPVVTQRCSRLEERSQDAENQLEQILHQVANLPRLLSASMLNLIFGTHRSLNHVRMMLVRLARPTIYLVKLVGDPLRGAPLFRREEGIICVSLRATAKERRTIGYIEPRSDAQALHKIGISNVKSAERDQVCKIALARLQGKCQIIAIIGNIESLERPPQFLKIESIWNLAWSLGRSLDDMDVSQVKAIQVLHDICICCLLYTSDAADEEDSV